MNRARTLPDLTAQQVRPGTGMCTKLLFLCGHKAQSTGGIFKGRVPLYCIDCNKIKEKA